MNEEQQIELLINTMYSTSENRQQAEDLYVKLVEESPYDIASYHLNYIFNNLQNNDKIKRGLTLLHAILKNSDVYQFFKPEQNEFIQTKLRDLVLKKELDENNRNYLLDIIELAQYYYNSGKAEEDQEYGWPSIFDFCIELSHSNDPASTYGIELISRFVKCGTFSIKDNIGCIYEIINNVFSSEKKNFPQIISTINLIFESYEEEEDMKQYAQNIIELIPEVPIEIIKQFIISIYLFPINFFEDTLPAYINTIATILADNQYPKVVKYYLLENIEAFLKEKKEILKEEEIYKPIIQSISIVFTLVELDDDFYLTRSAKYTLYLMSKTFDSVSFDNNCLEIATQYIQSDEWTFRFSGLSIYNSISAIIEDDLLLETAPIFISLIKDQSLLCQKTVLKIMKHIVVYKKDLLISNVEDQKDSSLYHVFYKTLLEAYANEPTPEIAIYGFKVLSKFCENSGSEILEQYYQPILQLFAVYSSETCIELHAYIIKCIRCLCKSMETHLSESYAQIKEYITNIISVNEPSITYSVIYCIPQVLKILPQKNIEEKYELASFGLSLFIKTISEEETYTEKQQIELFSSFSKFITTVAMDEDVEKVYRFVVDSLMKMASEKLDVEIVDDTDLELLPNHTCIIRHFNSNRKHTMLIFSQEKANEIQTAFRKLTKLIKNFPEKFFSFVSSSENPNHDLLNIIVEASKQLLINHQPISDCLKMLIEKYEVLNIQPKQLLDIIEKISTNFNVSESISVINYFIHAFKDLSFIQQTIDITNKILEQVKSYIKITNDEYEESKKLPNFDDKCDMYAKEYEQHRKSEYIVARFFSTLMKIFPELINEEFITFLHSIFPNDSKSNLAYMIIETRIQSLTTKDFSFIISNCGDKLEYGGCESIYTLDLIKQIIKSSIESQENAEIFKQVILSTLNLEDDFLEDNPEITLKAIYCLALLLKNYPSSIDENSLNAFVDFLPIYLNFQPITKISDKHLIFINSVFANQLIEKTDILVSETNIYDTFEIIAQLCNGRLIDEKTRLIFKQFMQSIFEQQQENEFIRDQLNQLKEIYVERLRNFVSPPK